MGGLGFRAWGLPGMYWDYKGECVRNYIGMILGNTHVPASLSQAQEMSSELHSSRYPTD